MNKSKKPLLTFGLVGFMLTVCVQAENYTQGQKQQNRYGNKNNKVIVGKDVPDVAKTNRYLYPEIQRDRVEMSTVQRQKQYREIQKMEDVRKKIVTGMYGINISMNPDIRLLKDIDYIKLSPNYITEIQLPPEMTITDARASFPTNRASFAKNSMQVQPKTLFYGGNISLYFTDGKKNYYMTIVCDRFFQNRAEVNDFISAIKKSSPSIAKEIAQKNENIGDYAYAKESFDLIHQYVLPKTLSPEDAIVLYERMTNSKGIDIENGDFVSFMYDGVVYKIYRDDTQGDLIYGKKAYRVENSLEQ